MLTMPLQTQEEPQGKASNPEALTYDRLGEWMLFAQIICSTFLQKAAIPFGGTQLYLGFFISIGLCVFGFVTKRLEFSRSRLPLYLVLLGGLSLTQVLGTYPPSILSFLFLLGIHVPYIFGLKNGMSRPGIELELFQKIAMIISVCAITQYFIQYLIGDYAYPIDAYFPKEIVMQGFNHMNPVGDDKSIYKSNGIFFLEPSMLSQFLAVAAVIEIVYFKRLKVLALFVLALGVTFSGTGLIILFLLIPFYLIQKKRYDVLIFSLFALVTAPLWAPMIGLENTIRRVEEFNNVYSSGYARFLSMFPFIGTYIMPETDTFLFGRGAGSIPNVEETHIDYIIFNPTWAKLFYEYGLIGSIFYSGFMIYIFKHPPRTAYLKWALLIQFVILGEFLLPPTVHSFVIALLVWPSMNAMQEFHEKFKNNQTAKRKAAVDAELEA